MISTLCAAVLGTAAPGPVHAQERADWNFGVRHWTTDEGLPSHFIPQIFQVSDGTLWMQTGGAPTRFDGLTFRRTQPTSKRGSMGLTTGASAGPGGHGLQRTAAVDQVVDSALARIVTGQTDPVPLGQVSFRLRGWTRVEVFEDGVDRVPGRMDSLRVAADGGS